MAYYHDLITEKSWEVLQQLKRQYDFIVIGGWAVYLYTKGLKSRDIDFVCTYEVLQKLKEKYELIKNDRLKKYEIHMGEFDVDIYVPFYSELGIPVEDLVTLTQSLDGFDVLMPEALLILKQKAYADRAGSAKGEKDKLDIIALVKDAVNIPKYKELLGRYDFNDYAMRLKEIFQETRSAPELGVSEYTFSKLKKKLASL